MRVYKAIVVLGSALAFDVSGIATAADAIPNLVGTWTGTFTGGVRSGGGDLAPADPKPTFVDERMNRLYTLRIDEQQGRGITGTWSSVSGSGAHPGCGQVGQSDGTFRRYRQLPNRKNHVSQ